jgi:hypothetical protein
VEKLIEKKNIEITMAIPGSDYLDKKGKLERKSAVKVTLW